MKVELTKAEVEYFIESTENTLELTRAWPLANDVEAKKEIADLKSLIKRLKAALK